MQNIDKLIFVGEHIKREAIHNFDWAKWEKEKFSVVPNYVEWDHFTLPKRPGFHFNLGIAGIVPRLKRFDRALDLLKNLRKDDKRFQLYVKGKKT